MSSRVVRAVRLMAFAGHCGRLLVTSTAVLACHVLTGRPALRPSVAAVPLLVDGDAQAAVVAGVVNLTPGTLILQIDEQQRILRVHAMFGAGPEEVRRDVIDLQHRLKGALR